MCDTIAATGSATSTGAVLFGKNSDREFIEAQYLELLPAARHAPGSKVRLTYKTIDQARQTHAVLLSKPYWIWGAEIGANEHGLAIGNTAIFSKIEASLAEGIIGMDYLRLALERATSVDEAIHVMTTLLREHGQSGKCLVMRDLAYHNSFILADPKGARILETVEREWVVRPVESHDAISNTMTIEQGFAASSPTLEARAIEGGFHQRGAPFAFKTAYEDPPQGLSGQYRRGRAASLLGEASGRLQVTDFFRVLRDHKEGTPLAPGRPGPRICSHVRDQPLGRTTGSWVASLSPGKTVHWVTGTEAPCTSLFKPVMFETGLPEHGPKPGAQEDAATLWWRHRQLHRALDERGDEFRQAFIGERDALEDKFLADLAQAPAVTDERSRAQTRGIVAACWREALAFEVKWHDSCLS